MGLQPVDRAAFRVWTNRIEAAINVASETKAKENE